MAQRRQRTNAVPLFVAAAVAYGTNCALGIAVATRIIDTRNFRWVHHALYIATCATTAAAVSSAVWSQNPRPALALLPAAAPLAAIPYVRTHSRRHPLVALTAAPFIVAGLVRALRPANRK